MRQLCDMLRDESRYVSEGASGTRSGTPIDVVEYGRGQVSALTYLSATSAREVHILRLRKAFERAGIVHKLRYSLSVLSLMREAQELGGGYWFPTPLRVVAIDGQAILVGPAPTHELQRHFRGVTRAGYARVLPLPKPLGLPNQKLDDWLGLRVRDSIAWSEAQIAEAQRSMSPAISSGNIQFFSVEPARAPFGSTTRPVWTNDPRSFLLQYQGMVLYRERVADQRFRYSLGRVEGARLTAEGPGLKDSARLQVGLAALAGKPFTVAVTKHDGESVFHIPTNLPRPERQLMLALGAHDVSLPGKAYRVCTDALSLIIERLQRLGYVVRSTHA